MAAKRSNSCALAAALLLVIGMSVAPSARAEYVSQSVDIGGRDVYLRCDGESASGAPTVVLISGYHDSSDVWTLDDVLSLHPPAVGPPVFAAIARNHRVCSYDRPGTIRYVDDGPLTERTTSVPQPRTVADIVAELDATLSAADISGPVLLVGHSLGGLIARAYTQAHPDRVAGVVFVDAFSPTVPALLGDGWAVYRDRGLNPPLQEMPIPSLRQPDSERVDLDAGINGVLAGPAFPNIPIAVLTKTEPFAGLSDLPGLSADVINRVYEEARSRTTSRLSQARRRRWPPAATTTSSSPNPI